MDIAGWNATGKYLADSDEMFVSLFQRSFTNIPKQR
jgi:hypothetical protein